MHTVVILSVVGWASFTFQALGLDKKGRLQESYQGNFDLYTCSFIKEFQGLRAIPWGCILLLYQSICSDKIIGHMLSMDHFVIDLVS